MLEYFPIGFARFASSTLPGQTQSTQSDLPDLQDLSPISSADSPEAGLNLTPAKHVTSSHRPSCKLQLVLCANTLNEGRGDVISTKLGGTPLKLTASAAFETPWKPPPPIWSPKRNGGMGLAKFPMKKNRAVPLQGPK